MPPDPNDPQEQLRKLMERSQRTGFISPQAESLLSVLPALVGAYEGARGRPIGAPMTVLGALGLEHAGGRKTQQQSVTGYLTELEALNKAHQLSPEQLTEGLRFGEQALSGTLDPASAEKALELSLTPKQKTTELVKTEGGYDVIHDLLTDTYHLPGGGPVPSKAWIKTETRGRAPSLVEMTPEQFQTYKTREAEVEGMKARLRPERVPPNLGSYIDKRWNSKTGHVMKYKVFFNPKNGNEVKREQAGWDLSAGERATLTEAVQINNQIPDMIAIANKVQAKLAGMNPREQVLEMKKQFKRYMAGAGGGGWITGVTGLFAGPPDPDFADYFSAMGSAQAQIGAGIKAFRAVKLWEQLRPHVPNPEFTPERNIERLTRLRDGRLKAALESVSEGVTGPITTPPEPPEPPPLPEPPSYGDAGLTPP